MRINHAHAGSLARLRIKTHAVYYAERTQGHASGFCSSGQSRVHAAEVRPRNAAPLTRTAVVASRAAEMVLRQNGGAANGQYAFAAKMPGQFLANKSLSAVQLHRRQEFAVGQLRKPQSFTRDAGEFLDIVVPGLEIGVSNGPVDGDSVAHIRFKIKIAPTVTLASPRDGTSTDLPPPNPAEGLSRRGAVGILFIVDKEFRGPFIAGVTQALNWLILFQTAAIAPAAKLHLPGWNVLDVILLWHDGSSRLEHQRLEPFLSEFFRGPSAGDSGTDYDRVIGDLLAHFAAEPPSPGAAHPS